MSSEEIHDKSVMIYDDEMVGQVDQNLDGPHLCPKSGGDRCATCNLKSDSCPGHIGCIHLDIPIANPLTYRDLKNVLKVVCIKCGTITLDDELRNNLLKRKLSERMNLLKKRFKTEKCQNCGGPIPTVYPVPVRSYVKSNVITVFSKKEIIKMGTKYNMKVDINELDLIDNIDVWNGLTMISDKDCELIGFNPEIYHPKLFMMNYVPIAPPLARPKVGAIGKSFVNNVTQMHKRIIMKKNLILNQIGKSSLTNISPDSLPNFLDDFEAICVAVCLLYIQPSEQEVAKLRPLVFDRGSASSIVSYTQLPGKKRGVFRGLILKTRHNVSARTVATAAPYAPLGTIAIPKQFAMKMGMQIRVTQFNIDTIRSLVKNGPNIYPGALGFIRNSRYIEIEEKNKDIIATSIMPGDLVDRHLIHGDIVISNRYPTLREESIDSLMVNITNQQTFGVPLSSAGKKNLDFDGDEIQIFIPKLVSSRAETLILQSNFMQLIAPKDANLAIYGTNDTVSGILALVNHDKFSRKTVEMMITKDLIKDNKETYTSNEIISLFLPDKLYYASEKITIKKGVITDGKFTPKAVCGSDAFLLKAIAHNISNYDAIMFLNNMTRIAYISNRIIGQTQIYDFNLKPVKEMCKLVEERIKEIDDFTIKSHNKDIHIPLGINPWDYVDGVIRNKLVSVNAVKIEEELINSLKGTVAEKNGFTDKFATQLVRMMVSVGQIVLHTGVRPDFKLAHNSRALPAFPRYSDGAKQRGYIEECYANGLKFVSQFFECEEHRHQIYSKGVLVADQGYFERIISTLLSAIYAGYFGEIRADSHSITCFTYGTLGIDPRHIIRIKEDMFIISDKEFKERFDNGIKEEYDLLLSIRDKWRKDIICHKNHTSAVDDIQKVFDSPIDFDYIINYVKKESGKAAKKEDIWNELLQLPAKLFKLHMNNKSGGLMIEIINHRIDGFIRLLLSKVNSKRLSNFSLEECKELINEIIIRYRNSLIQAGEPIGMKVSLCVTEPLTQSVLNAIHGTVSISGGSGVKRSHGLPRFKELLQGKKEGKSAHKDPIWVTTFVLKDKHNFDEQLKFAHEIETIMLKDLIYPSYLISTEKIAGNDDDIKFVEKWYKSLPSSLANKVRQIDMSTFKLKINFSTTDLYKNGIKLSEIQKAITACAPDIITFMAIERTTNPITRVMVYFKSGRPLDALKLVCEKIIMKTIVHGSHYFKNATVIENKGTVIVDNNGQLINKPSYRIEANGLNFKFAIKHSAVNANESYSNNIQEMYHYFGVIEARQRLYEEMLYEAKQSSDLSVLLKQHFKLIADFLTYRGDVASLDRHKLKTNYYMDPMSKMAFEEIQAFTKLALKESRRIPLDDAVIRTMYGLKLKEGTGFSTIMFKTSDLGPKDKSGVIGKLFEKSPRKIKGGGKQYMSNHKSLSSLEDDIIEMYSNEDSLY
jgi:DNA-directed RNA polymerase beta' subunit